MKQYIELMRFYTQKMNYHQLKKEKLRQTIQKQLKNETIKFKKPK